MTNHVSLFKYDLGNVTATDGANICATRNWNFQAFRSFYGPISAISQLLFYRFSTVSDLSALRGELHNLKENNSMGAISHVLGGKITRPLREAGQLLTSRDSQIAQNRI